MIISRVTSKTEGALDGVDKLAITPSPSAKKLA